MHEPLSLKACGDALPANVFFQADADVVGFASCDLRVVGCEFSTFDPTATWHSSNRFFTNNLLTKFHAFVADIHARPCDEPANVFLALAAKRAAIVGYVR